MGKGGDSGPPPTAVFAGEHAATSTAGPPCPAPAARRASGAGASAAERSRWRVRAVPVRREDVQKVLTPDSCQGGSAATVVSCSK